jgi:hypothetical protein
MQSAAHAGDGKLIAPVPYRVYQRSGFDPRHAHEHEPGGAKLGEAFVPVTLACSGAPAKLEYRIAVLNSGFGKAVDWTPLDGTFADSEFRGRARVPAGGWYRLEVRGPDVSAAVEPIGVGEVFLIAGQSYATNYNDAVIRVDDPQGRVSAYHVVKRSWAVAHDPQPTFDSGTGGTVWPTMASHLLPLVRVPIGFANVAVGGTASRQWLPGEKLYLQAAKVGREVGRFRAVLWQQGESDVIGRVSTEQYVKNLAAIRTGLAKEWEFNPPWLLAKSTLHPTVYNDPVHEGQIRAAIDQLIKQSGFRPGPDTDILGGENRGGPQTLRHFSPLGQKNAGAMWFTSVWQELNRE